MSADKEKTIKYWTMTAEDDLGSVDLLFNGGKYVHALFWMHLALEKILKAHWVKDNVENVPPKTHNLLRLQNETSLNVPMDDMAFLQRMNTFQIEGRYPEYLSMLHQTTQKTETQDILSQAKSLFQCLHEKLQ